MNSAAPFPFATCRTHGAHRQRGAALLIGLTVLIVISLLSISAMRQSVLTVRIGANAQQVERLSQGADSLLEEVFDSSQRLTISESQAVATGGSPIEELTMDTSRPVFGECDPESSRVSERLYGKNKPPRGWGTEFAGVNFEVRARCVARDTSTDPDAGANQPALDVYAGGFRATSAGTGGGSFVSTN